MGINACNGGGASNSAGMPSPQPTTALPNPSPSPMPQPSISPSPKFSPTPSPTPIGSAQLTVNIATFSDIAKFSSLSSLSISLIDLSTNKTYNANILLSANYVFNNLPANDNYELISNGIADEYNRLYYQGVDNKFNLKAGANSKSIILTKSSATTHNVQFALVGITNPQNTMLNLTESASISPSSYLYLPVKLESNHNYVFLNTKTPSITLTNSPAGYFVNYQPKIISSSTNQVVLTFSKITETYDFIAPFKDYNAN